MVERMEKLEALLVAVRGNVKKHRVIEWYHSIAWVFNHLDRPLLKRHFHGIAEALEAFNE